MIGLSVCIGILLAVSVLGFIDSYKPEAAMFSAFLLGCNVWWFISLCRESVPEV